MENKSSGARIHAENVRINYGRRAGILGVIGNCTLFLLKFAVGTASNSIAIIADSFNNLMDCTGSFITILGFHISAKGRDSRHPFGHGRAEYLCGLFIALIILSAAISLGKSSVQRLMEPETLTVTLPMFLVPLASVLIKTFLIMYITRINRSLDSSALRAAVREDYADMLITALTILTLLAAPRTDIPADGIAGLVITVFILWSGLTALRENMDLLMGTADRQLTEQICSIILGYDIFGRVISCAVHDYGPSAKTAVICVALNPRAAAMRNLSPQPSRKLRNAFAAGWDSAVSYTAIPGRSETPVTFRQYRWFPCAVSADSARHITKSGSRVSARSGFFTSGYGALGTNRTAAFRHHHRFYI